MGRLNGQALSQDVIQIYSVLRRDFVSDGPFNANHRFNMLVDHPRLFPREARVQQNESDVAVMHAENVSNSLATGAVHLALIVEEHQLLEAIPVAYEVHDAGLV